ncbi:MAG: YDG domain-containing protein, partial [Candidatus Omnitrophica bacterium]|nr:YDG domain-containing protein [Candidatus Omnitrophota bacterium]
YAITQGSLTAGDNYTLSFVSNDFSITQRPITVTADPSQTKVYGEDDPTFTYKITSGTMAYSDELTGALSRVPGKDKGSYAITQGSLDISTNYDITFVSADFSITPKQLTIGGSFVVNNKIYDGTDTATILSNSLTLPGAVKGDDVGLIVSAVFSNKTAENTKTVSLTVESSLTGADASNYTLVLAGAPTTTANITAKELTVTGITANNKTYDGTATATLNTGAAVLSGEVDGDTIALNVSSAVGLFADQSVGDTKVVTITGLTVEGIDAGNYSIIPPTTTANIARGQGGQENGPSSSQMFEFYQPSFLPSMAMSMSAVMSMPMMTAGSSMMSMPMVVMAPTMVSTPVAVPAPMIALPVPASVPAPQLPGQPILQEAVPESPVLVFKETNVVAEFAGIVSPEAFRNIEISAQIPNAVNFEEVNVESSASKVIMPNIFNNIEILVNFMAMPRG